MSRRFTWAALVAAGFLFGFLSGSPEKTSAQPPSGDGDAAVQAVAELKAIRTQLKEINTLLHHGTVKTVVVINPDKTQ